MNLPNLLSLLRIILTPLFIIFLFSDDRLLALIIFAVAAVLTPPDPITQIGLAMPLLLLYELSIFTVKFIEKKEEEDA